MVTQTQEIQKPGCNLTDCKKFAWRGERACLYCPGKGREHCQKCGTDYDTLLVMSLEPIGTQNSETADKIIESCVECKRWIVTTLTNMVADDERCDRMMAR